MRDRVATKIKIKKNDFTQRKRILLMPIQCTDTDKNSTFGYFAAIFLSWVTSQVHVRSIVTSTLSSWNVKQERFSNDKVPLFSRLYNVRLTFSSGTIARSSAPLLCSRRCSSRHCPVRSVTSFADSAAWWPEVSPCCRQLGPPLLPPWRPYSHHHPPLWISSCFTSSWWSD